MSATFWNMRRKLRAQKRNEAVIITDIAKAQEAEKAENNIPKPLKQAKKPTNKKAGAKNDSKSSGNT